MPYGTLQHLLTTIVIFLNHTLRRSITVVKIARQNNKFETRLNRILVVRNLGTLYIEYQVHTNFKHPVLVGILYMRILII